MKTKSTNTTTNHLFAGRCSSTVGSAIRPLTSVFSETHLNLNFSSYSAALRAATNRQPNLT